MALELDIERTIMTITRLRQRIVERFPGSGLSGVCRELESFAGDCVKSIDKISRPNYVLRIVVGLFIALAIVGAIFSISLLEISFKNFGFGEFIALFESLVNDLVLVGAAVFFLFTIESRLKRRKALKYLNTLRAIAHVIDMHQLTKDPNYDATVQTPSSPARDLTPYELSRYLSYCGEMLSLTGKVAALYAKGTDDGVVMDTINEIEELTSGLSRKIWQKIMVLPQHADRMGSSHE